MPQATENGADMEEEEVDDASYMIIIAALKARKAKLKQADSQLRNQIAELQEEILEMEESNQSHCSCSYEGEHTSTGTRTATHDATRMARSRWDMMSAAGTSQLVPSTTTLERYNETRGAKLVSSLKKLYIYFVIQQEECETDFYEQSSDQKFIVANYKETALLKPIKDDVYSF